MLRRVHGPTLVTRSMDNCHGVDHHGRLQLHKRKSFDSMYNVNVLGHQLHWSLLSACITKLEVDQECTPQSFRGRARVDNLSLIHI
eukprot:2661357-Pyramimonas_sp.AAC.1